MTSGYCTELVDREYETKALIKGLQSVKPCTRCVYVYVYDT